MPPIVIPFCDSIYFSSWRILWQHPIYGTAENNLLIKIMRLSWSLIVTLWICSKMSKRQTQIAIHGTVVKIWYHLWGDITRIQGRDPFSILCHLVYNVSGHIVAQNWPKIFWSTRSNSRSKQISQDYVRLCCIFLKNSDEIRFTTLFPFQWYLLKQF